jgi:hypothetical protein
MADNIPAVGLPYLQTSTGRIVYPLSIQGRLMQWQYAQTYGEGDLARSAIHFSTWTEFLSTHTPTILTPPVITPPIPSITYPAGTKVLWHAADITGVADGATTTWTDRLAGVTTAAGSAAPVYKASVAEAGGVPGVRFSGGATLNASANTVLDGITNNAANNTNGAVFTLAIVMYLSAADIAANKATGQSTPVGSYGHGTNLWPVTANGIGSGNGNPDYGVDITPGVHVMLLGWGDGYNYDPNCFWDGTVFAPNLYGTFNGGLCIGGVKSDYPGGYWSGTMLQVRLYNRALSQVDALQLQKAVCDETKTAYPWAGTPAFLACIGDSLTFNYLASAYASYPTQMAKILGRKHGSFTRLGYTGTSWSYLESKAQAHVDGISAVTGIPTAVLSFEWYNQAKGTQNGGDPAAAIAFQKSRRQKDPTCKLVFGTSTDANNSEIAPYLAGRTTYDNYWDTKANRDALGLDGYAALHLNQYIGVTGAAAASTASTYYNDDRIHWKDPGALELAKVFAASVQAAGLA